MFRAQIAAISFNSTQLSRLAHLKFGFRFNRLYLQVSELPYICLYHALLSDIFIHTLNRNRIVQSTSVTKKVVLKCEVMQCPLQPHAGASGWGCLDVFVCTLVGQQLHLFVIPNIRYQSHLHFNINIFC